MAGLTFTKTFSTATWVGECWAMTCAETFQDRLQAIGQLPIGSAHHAAGEIDQLLARALDQAKAGDTQSRVDAEDANRDLRHGDYSSTTAVSLTATMSMPLLARSTA